ncbi:MAG TPA: hypothetical protein VK921_13295 [Anditalea sp.]|nr:hypothetical protein [Anditalea sp.]
MSTSAQTHDHDKIRKWAEARGGVPAVVKDTSSADAEGVLRIHFPKNSDSNSELEEISWEDFFKNFDKNKLDFLYQDKKSDGQESTFHKFVNRD